MKWLALIGCLVALLVAGCGQKGALYLPDKQGTVVTSAPAATALAPPAVTPQAKKPADPNDPGDPNEAAPPSK